MVNNEIIQIIKKKIALNEFIDIEELLISNKQKLVGIINSEYPCPGLMNVVPLYS